MSFFDRLRRRLSPEPKLQSKVDQPLAAGSQPANRRLFPSQALDGLVKVSAEERALLQQHFAEARVAFPGLVYLEWLQFFHYFVEPETYLEIGVETGASFAFAQPPTLAVGVDPLLEIKHELKARHKLYNLTSDEFFATQDIAAVFEGRAIALAFIDGLHTFDQALKDFSNVERHATRSSIVLFHDVFPLNATTAGRDRNSVFWTGDTWKAICLLRRHRPDLKIFTIPTFPSGLTVVTHLDPTSRFLTDGLGDVCAREHELTFDGRRETMSRHLNEIANEPAAVVTLLNG
jgi:Methyltransferase domain